jgi:alkylation response protein AidB-like acyl-CoA dehydrogenase
MDTPRKSIFSPIPYRDTRGQAHGSQKLIEFPRVADKIAVMAAEIMIARQISYHAARKKDKGRRCDLGAGMAKLLAARVAWVAADNAVQIHGGNGFALEYKISRILCDARILSIFEGAAEIQAQVIGAGACSTAAIKTGSSSARDPQQDLSPPGDPRSVDAVPSR